MKTLCTFEELQLKDRIVFSNNEQMNKENNFCFEMILDREEIEEMEEYMKNNLESFACYKNNLKVNYAFVLDIIIYSDEQNNLFYIFILKSFCKNNESNTLIFKIKPSIRRVKKYFYNVKKIFKKNEYEKAYNLISNHFKSNYQNKHRLGYIALENNKSMDYFLVDLFNVFYLCQNLDKEKIGSLSQFMFFNPDSNTNFSVEFSKETNDKKYSRFFSKDKKILFDLEYRKEENKNDLFIEIKNLYLNSIRIDVNEFKHTLTNNYVDWKFYNDYFEKHYSKNIPFLFNNIKYELRVDINLQIRNLLGALYFYLQEEKQNTFKENLNLFFDLTFKNDIALSIVLSYFDKNTSLFEIQKKDKKTYNIHKSKDEVFPDKRERLKFYYTLLFDNIFKEQDKLYSYLEKYNDLFFDFNLNNFEEKIQYLEYNYFDTGYCHYN